MNSFITRFTAVLFQCLIGSAFAGIADGLLAGLRPGTPFLPTFVSVFALTTSAMIVFSVAFATTAGLLFPGCADQTCMPARLKEALFPGSTDTRFKNGVLLFAAFVEMAVFIITVAFVGKILVEGMATTIYATLSTALIALITGLSLLGIFLNVARRIVRPHNIFKGHFSDIVISPVGALLIVIMLCAPVAWIVRDRLLTILSVLPHKLILLTALTVAVSISVGIVTSFKSIPSRLKQVVFGGIPTLTAISLIISASGLGIDSDVKIAITSDATFSPAAFKLAKKTLDFDGDGFVNLLADGDCDPFNSSICAGATEIPNNGIDEDCDGEDLRFDPKTDTFEGKWDFAVSPEVSKKKFNVIFLTIDAGAPDRMSLYGHNRQTTPNLEKIAAQSGLFKRAFSAGPSTRLSIPEMMTSKYGPDVDRAVGFRVPLEIKPSNLTMAEIFKKAGYKTIAITPTVYFKNWKGILQGFDRIDHSAAEFDTKKYAFHSGEKVTENVISVLNKEVGNNVKPIFLWVHYYDTHHPYTLPPGEKKFGDRTEDIYDTEMLYADKQLGRVVEELDKLYDPENTILIISADHGEAFDDNHKVKRHGYDLHSTITHIPLIIRAPFIKPGVFEGPVNAIDLLPTLVNLLGLKGNYTFSGTSLVPQLVDGKDDVDRTVYSLFYLPENVYHKKRTMIMAGARTASLNYFKDMESNTEQMFDFLTDPYETNNLIEQYPKKAAALRRDVSKFLMWLENNTASRKTPKGTAASRVNSKATKDKKVQYGPPKDILGPSRALPLKTGPVPVPPPGTAGTQPGPVPAKVAPGPAPHLETHRNAPDNKH